MLAHLSIGPAERTERVNLIDTSGFCLDELGWIPQAGDHATSWRESALADYRQPASYKDLTTIETFNLLLQHGSQDLVIRKTQDLRRVLRDALNYWISRTSSDVIYIEARASCETNTRYAVVYEGRLPHDDYPDREPFTAGGMANMMLVLERGPWLSNVPGVGTTILIQGTEDWCFPSHLTFDGVDDRVNCAHDVKLDELPGFAVFGKGPITVEAWIRPVSYGEGGVGHIIEKTDWAFMVWDTQGLNATVTCVGQQARSSIDLTRFSVDGDWHHVVMTYSEVAAAGYLARLIYIAIDGVWATAYNLQQPSIGNYIGDGPDIVYIGDRAASDRCFDGDIGWVRVSNSVRYNPGQPAPFTDFIPPARCTLPDIDVNTMGQWVKEGQGTTVANQSGGTPGVLTDANKWDCDCPETYGYIPPEGGTGATGWWDPDDEGLCVWGAWQAKDADNFATSLVDLTGNGNDLGDPGGANTPGWAVGNGWIFDGINDYLISAFIPALDQSQAMLCQFTSWVDIAGNNYLAGSYTIANSYFTIAPDNGNIIFGGNGQNHWYFGAAYNNGNLGVSGFRTYKNGVPLIGVIITYSAVPTRPLYVGCFNNNGAAAGFAQVQMSAFVIYDCHLTHAQMLRVQTAMAAI